MIFLLKFNCFCFFFFFSRHETYLSILTTISCNFQFVNTYMWCDQITALPLMSFYFVYKITKYYNFLKGNLLYKKIIHRYLGAGDLNHECLHWKLRCQPVNLQDSR